MSSASVPEAVPKMTNRYTDAEWTQIIEDTEKKVKVSNESYERPQIGSLEFTKTVDHTLLKLDATPPQFDALCSEARVNQFATVCVRPEHVERCVANLRGSDVQVASVIGFHEGTYELSHKLQETKTSLAAGAAELDVVLNYPQLLAGAYSRVFTELAALRQQAPAPTRLKLILETSQLPQRRHIVAACTLAAAASFDFVKTSTGFNGPGATEEHVRLMRACCEALEGWRGAEHGGSGAKMRVKASGGVRTLADAVTMLEAGAARLGASSGVWIAKEANDWVAAGGAAGGLGDAKDSRPALSTRLFTDY